MLYQIIDPKPTPVILPDNLPPTPPPPAVIASNRRREVKDESAIKEIRFLSLSRLDVQQSSIRT